MKKYRMVMSPIARDMMRRHERFLQPFNRDYTRRMKLEFSKILYEIRWNPFMFPVDESLNLPEKQYRKALFCQWYKALFRVEESTVYLDAVVDCRMDPEKMIRELK